MLLFWFWTDYLYGFDRIYYNSKYNIKLNRFMYQLYYSNHILYNIAHCIFDKYTCTYNFYTRNMIPSNQQY